MTTVANSQPHQPGAWVDRAYNTGVGTSVSTGGLEDPASLNPAEILLLPIAAYKSD